MNSYNGFTPTQRQRAYDWAKVQQWPAPVACDACGQDEGLIERHSEDYSEPFGPHIGQFGLCYCCHMMVHCRFKSPERWDAYRKSVAAGAIYRPFVGKLWPAFRELFLSPRHEMPEPVRWRDPPARRLLDEIEAGALLPGATAAA